MVIFGLLCLETVASPKPLVALLVLVVAPACNQTSPSAGDEWSTWRRQRCLSTILRQVMMPAPPFNQVSGKSNKAVELDRTYKLESVIVTSEVTEDGFFIADGTNRPYSGLCSTYGSSSANLLSGDLIDVEGVVENSPGTQPPNRYNRNTHAI